MNYRIVPLIALLFASATAIAADPAVQSRPASSRPEATKTAVAGKVDPATRPGATARVDPRAATVSTKVAGGSQQNKMRECNKSAVGKKGQERKDFMRSCLSSHKG